MLIRLFTIFMLLCVGLVSVLNIYEIYLDLKFIFRLLRNFQQASNFPGSALGPIQKNGIFRTCKQKGSKGIFTFTRIRGRKRKRVVMIRMRDYLILILPDNFVVIQNDRIYLLYMILECQLSFNIFVCNAENGK
jgi:hypothetical protein